MKNIHSYKHFRAPLRGVLGGLCFLALGAQAQVTNYALTLGEGETATLPQWDAAASLSAYTLQMWVKPAKWGGVLLTDASGAFRLSIGEAGALELVGESDKVTFNATNVQLDKWSHLTLTYDGEAARLYVNNKLVGEQKSAGLALKPSDNGWSIAPNGAIDEFRVWDTVLPEEYERFWRNTLNEYCPSWSHLKMYYTFDQVECPVLWDYTGKGHHGQMTDVRQHRTEVTDNANFKYRINLAYADFNRYCDRMVDAEKYRLSNHVAMIGIMTANDGSARLQYPYHEASPEGAAHWMADYEGRKGVMALDGSEGTRLSLGTGVMEPWFNGADGYTFMTWICLDEWTEGAYIYRKERATQDGGYEGFSIRLGDPETRQVIVRCNGHEYIRDKKLKAGQWMHLAVSTNVTTNQGEVFLFAFDGAGSFPSRGNFPSELYSSALPDLSDTEAYIGEGLKAKLDETVIWNTARTSTDIANEMQTLKIPSPTMAVDAQLMRKSCALWDYDLEQNPGYDKYSFRHFFNTIRECYGDCQGYKLLITASGHDGWESTFANSTKRTKLGKAIAEIGNLPDFDGIDLDFEWTYNSTGWSNYAQLCKVIRENLDEGKLLSVSPHQVAYGFPTNMMKYVDFFNFQVYGPGQTYLFTEEGYTSALQQFVNHGYPKDKIVMSYATTTSGGCDANGSVIRNGNAIAYAPIGFRNFYDVATTQASDNRAYYSKTDAYYYYTGYDQSVWRAQQCHEQQIGGIMYWDMGNDIATSEPLSLARGASLALNSNVVPLYTSADGETLPPLGIAAPQMDAATTSSLFPHTSYLLDGRSAANGAHGIVIEGGKKTLKK
ncbi:MAG: LamG-like jellyroll fold domain-containing protein [Bacteroidales bacterium]|nr:LamG-like jellyroll fold domain-containing protein [Bacteroidales bacterium]